MEPVCCSSSLNAKQAVYTRLKLLLLVSLLLVLLLVTLYYSLRWFKPANSGQCCYLYVRKAGNGTITVGEVGEHAKLLKARPAPGWRFKHWLVNGSLVSTSPILRLVLRGNTTVVAVFEPLPRYRLTVIVHGNGAVAGPVNATLLEGENVKLVFKPARGWRVGKVAVNGRQVGNVSRLELVVDRDYRVDVIFVHVGKLYKYAVRIVSNVNATFWLNGSVYRVPELVGSSRPFTAVIEGAWRVPYNATHSWWLAWYWVREGNRSWWWSYGLNGSRLTVRVRGNTTVELHYVLGLRNLPYILKWENLMEPYYEHWPGGDSYRVNITVRDGWMIMKRVRSRFCVHLAMVIPQDIGWIAFENYVKPGRGFRPSAQSFIFLRFDGSYMMGQPAPSIMIKNHTIIYLNIACLREAWRLWKKWYDEYGELVNELTKKDDPKWLEITRSIDLVVGDYILNHTCFMFVSKGYEGVRAVAPCYSLSPYGREYGYGRYPDWGGVWGVAYEYTSDGAVEVRMRVLGVTP